MQCSFLNAKFNNEKKLQKKNSNSMVYYHTNLVLSFNLFLFYSCLNHPDKLFLNYFSTLEFTK